ncbi:MAG: OmpL47-type beta-barrel domain-containing protein [Thiohalospira sp.]
MISFKNSLLFFSLFVFSFALKSQEPLVHQKKFFVSDDGKMYVHKEMPLYFRVSSSPDENAPSHLLIPAADSKKYTNPMYLDTEGYNSLHSPSKVDTATKKAVYPLEDIIFEIYADSRAPVTSFSLNNKNYYKNDNIYYFDEPVELAFEAKDAMSGVEETYYSINGQNYQKLTNDIIFDKEVLYEVKYYSVDHVGNAEEPKQINIKVDITPPVTELSVNTDNYNDILSSRSKIILEASDDNSKVKQTFFSINGGTEYNYRQPIIISGLDEGEHSVEYYSVDHVGNIEDKKTYDFYLDKTPPMVVDELIGNTFIANGREYSSGRSKVKLTAMDNKAGVKEIRYSINDGEFQVYTQPFYLNKSGKLKIQTFVIDNVNNQNISTIMADKSNISYVDLSGPALGHHFEGPSFKSKDTTFITRNTKIRLSAKDDASGTKRIEYSIDNGLLQEYTAPFNINKEGAHTVNYIGYDNVDNSSNNSFICVEDNTGPEIFFRFSMLSEKTKVIGQNKYDVYPSHVVLFLSSTDSLVGFDKIVYSVNGSPPRAYNSLIKDFNENQRYKIDVKSYDKLGNKSEKSIEFFIE